MELSKTWYLGGLRDLGLARFAGVPQQSPQDYQYPNCNNLHVRIKHVSYHIVRGFAHPVMVHSRTWVCRQNGCAHHVFAILMKRIMVNCGSLEFLPSGILYPGIYYEYVISKYNISIQDNIGQVYLEMGYFSAFQWVVIPFFPLKQSFGASTTETRPMIPHVVYLPRWSILVCI